MGFALYLSGCTLPAIGLIRALEERDIAPCGIVARAGGALVGGLYASGLSSAALEHVAVMLSRNSLALLNQLLPALRRERADMSPCEIAAAVLGEHACALPERAVHAERADGMVELINELTDGMMLCDARIKIEMPVRAYSIDGITPPIVRKLSSTVGARCALSMAEAIRCAAFPADVFSALSVGGRLLGACGDREAHAFVNGTRAAVCLNMPGDELICAPHVRIEAAPFDPHGGVREQIAAGYDLAQRNMNSILAMC